MKKETKTVVFDEELHLEAYRFEGMVQPFPNHFHEYYVIGFIEGGKRCLSCKNREYAIEQGNVILFNPGDNHACVPECRREIEQACSYMEIHYAEHLYLDQILVNPHCFGHLRRRRVWHPIVI